jgi:predicted ArsR family transcriptional regulator/anti-sigma regulatory factor (Ser/Thr protein kinase)
MDVEWFLERAPLATASRLRREIRSYLERHGTGDLPDLQAAELAVGELLANAYDHGAGPIWVTLDWSGERPLLAVHDLGPTFEISTVAPDALAERGRGLWLVSQVTTELSTAAKRAGGKVVSARLPVSRKLDYSIDPPRHTINPLPGLDEAGPAGFGRESFLRALAVQLATVLEDRHGPRAAQEAVAQVGADVANQVEQEYRRALSVPDERLTAEQIAECYVRLKRAIGGDFFIIEVTAERIVLGNARCPFGDAVRRSPTLCRMTSSVFGGIGARNTGAATVQLQERLAIGDPGCRVVVHLGAAPGLEGHHYASEGHPPGAKWSR